MANPNYKKQKVIKALENPNYKWRTLAGISKETGLAEAEVLDAIRSNRGIVVQSTIPSKNGSDLYSTRKHIREKASTIERLMGAFKNRAI